MSQDEIRTTRVETAINKMRLWRERRTERGKPADAATMRLQLNQRFVGLSKIEIEEVLREALNV